MRAGDERAAGTVWMRVVCVDAHKTTLGGGDKVGVQCEGLVAKALDGAPYEPGRRADTWVRAVAVAAKSETREAPRSFAHGNRVAFML